MQYFKDCNIINIEKILEKGGEESDSKKVKKLTEENWRLLESSMNLSRIKELSNKILDMCTKKDFNSVLIFFDVAEKMYQIIGITYETAERKKIQEEKFDGIKIQEEDMSYLEKEITEKGCLLTENQYAKILLFEVLKK